MADKIIFKNIIGTFVFDNQFHVIESHKGDFENEYFDKYRNADWPNDKQIQKILDFFRDKEFFEIFYQGNLKLTKKAVKESVTSFVLICQAVNSIIDTDKSINVLSKRLRDWYAWTAPEAARSIPNNEQFAAQILKKGPDILLKEIGLSYDQSMGKKIGDDDLAPLQGIAWQICQLYLLRLKEEKYLEFLMNKEYPNLSEVAGFLIGARLLSYAGSADRLIKMPASTIQILGAEKALFRHMRDKKKSSSPKHGVLYQHLILQSAKPSQRGKIARLLADKIVIAIRVDHFKGEFVGSRLKDEIIAKVRSLK